MFMNLFGVKPYKSRYTEEEYQKYKKMIGDSLARQMALGVDVADIRCDDKHRHIVLFNFNGCMMGEDTFVVPEGVSIVYVEETSMDERVDLNVAYNLVLSDTVQYIDALPFKHLMNFDTNKLEAIRVNNLRLDVACWDIQNVIVRDTFNNEKSIGHFAVDNVFFSMEKGYKLQGNQAFLTQSEDAHVTKIHVDEKCECVNLGDRKAEVCVYVDGNDAMPKIKMNARSEYSVQRFNISMDEALEKVLSE